MHDTAPDETAHSRSSSLEFIAYTKTGPPPFNVPADFIIRTPQGTDWHVSAAILAFASPYFRALPRDPPAPGAPFVLAVPESDALLEALLRLAYPLPDPPLCDLDDVAAAHAAARKYALGAAQDALARMFFAPRFVAREPLHVYALAARLGLPDAADAAAFHACKSSPAAWPPCAELAHISGAQLHALLVYHRRRAALALQALQGADLGARCERCGKRWAKKYRARAARVLRDAPTDLRVFEVGFVAKVARGVGCGECSHGMLQALRPEGALAKLKAEVEGLPLSVIRGVLHRSGGPCLVLTRKGRVVVRVDVGVDGGGDVRTNGGVDLSHLPI